MQIPLLMFSARLTNSTRTAQQYNIYHKNIHPRYKLVLFDGPLKYFEWSVVILNLYDYIS